MKSYIVVYQLENSSNDYSKISEKLKSYSGWAKPFDRTWLIKTDKSAVEIRNELASSIERRGSIMVIRISEAAWATSRVQTNINDWMHENV